MKLKLLYVVSVFPPSRFGGVKTVSYIIARNMVKRGHDVTVFTTDADISNPRLNVPRERNLDGIRVKYFKNMSNTLAFKYRIFMPFEMIFELRREERAFDIIHIHEYYSFPAIISSYYAKKYNRPYVLQSHGSLTKITRQQLKLMFDRLFGREILKSATKVIALNSVEAEQYRAMSVPEEKIAIIPNGIDLSEYVNLPPNGTFKKKFNIPEDKKIILYLGRIHKIKGIDILIKAYAYMRNKMNLRDIVLVIVGPDDGYLNEAKRLAQALDVSNHVLFTGPLYGEDKMAAYIDSEVYVLPSRYETFPMTILEAYACGKPVVASEVGGLRDLVKNGETGLLFKPEDVK